MNNVSKPYIIGAIFARGGSKGIERKNLRLLEGKPLLAHAIETAKKVKLIQKIVVSTDDREIAQTARRWGAEVPFMRPAELAQDNSPEWLVWQHAINALKEIEGRKPDVMVSVPATSPLRSAGDIEACLNMLLDSDADAAIAVTTTDRNPYFNMVVLENGYARPVVAPDKPIYRRQDAPVVYDMTTAVYAVKTDFVLRARSLFEGKIKAVVIPRERALDIDTELDLKFAEFLMNHENKNLQISQA